MSHSLDILISESYFEENFAFQHGAGIMAEVNKDSNETFRHVKPYKINTTIADTIFIRNKLNSRGDLEKGGAIYMANNDICYESSFVLSGTDIVESIATRADGAGV